MKLGILIIFAVFFGTIFWAIGGQEIRQEIPFYSKKILGKTIKVEINGYSLEVEVAKSDNEKRRGLSQRDELRNDRGMIFIYEKEGEYSFWMKGVKFSLDFIWLKGDKIVDITKNVQPPRDENYEIYRPSEPVDKILEVKAGWCDSHEVKIGQKVKFYPNLWGVDVLK